MGFARHDRVLNGATCVFGVRLPCVACHGTQCVCTRVLQARFCMMGMPLIFFLARWGAELSSRRSGRHHVECSIMAPQQTKPCTRGRESTYASNVIRQHGPFYLTIVALARVRTFVMHVLTRSNAFKPDLPRCSSSNPLRGAATFPIALRGRPHSSS